MDDWKISGKPWISANGSSDRQLLADRKVKCRACGSEKLKLGLDLGKLPLANSFLSHQRAMDPSPEPKYPLQVFYCTACHLIQLIDIVDRREMYDDYAFLTATAQTSLVHFNEYADQVGQQIQIRSGDLVVDIGSNDGTLLKGFKRQGAKVVGVEPAGNVANVAIADGVETLIEYFGPQTVQRLGERKARIITANNVISHVGDLNMFVESVGSLLEPEGLFVFEVPWIVEVFRHYNFDIIYHEHLTYFGFKPLSKLLERHGLELVEIHRFPNIHGGSLRGFVAHREEFSEQSGALNSIFRDEESDASFQSLERFASSVEDFRAKLVTLLRSLKSNGKNIVGYGAPAKATILLNYCKIDRSILDFVIDTTPFKQGRFIPGVRVPIFASEKFREARPDYALLLAWNFKDEILNKERAYLESGGKFIVPFPTPVIIDSDILNRLS